MSEKETVKFDAEGKTLGRFASKVAHTLQGKDLPSYKPNEVPDRKVVVENASGIEVSGKKEKQKTYKRHSGHPGGLKEKSYQELKEEDPSQIIIKAVKGMLPKNKLRKKMLKKLEVQNE